MRKTNHPAGAIGASQAICVATLASAARLARTPEEN
jgi:hypothetical protein